MVLFACAIAGCQSLGLPMTASLPAGLVAGQPATVVAELRNTTNCTLDTAAIIVPLLEPLDPSEAAVWRGFCADPVDYCLANPDASACLQLFELCDILPGLGLCQAFCEKVSDGTAPWCENGRLSAAATPTSAAEILALLPAHVRDRIDAGALQAFLDRFADTSGSTSAPELLGPASAIPLSCALGTGEFGGLGAFCGEGAPVMLPPSDTLRITATGTVPADLPGGYWLGFILGFGGRTSDTQVCAPPPETAALISGLRLDYGSVICGVVQVLPPPSVPVASLRGIGGLAIVLLAVGGVAGRRRYVSRRRAAR